VQNSEEMQADPDLLKIGGKIFQSRLLLGTSRYPSPGVLSKALQASGTELITVSVRRINLEEKQRTFLGMDELKAYHLLPNTAGCYTARDAVFTAQMAREALNTNWVKVEVIGDEKTLMPDALELLKACEELIKDGFTVLPYVNDDPVLCRRLADLGCAAIMPLASPIGSGQGIRNPHALEMIREFIPHVPLIVDAGIGTASDAALAMELGYDAILMNTAVAEAMDPVGMANAMKHAVIGGRLAYLSGRIPKIKYAQASTPDEGKIVL
jgi:thiazole synthase